MFEGFTDAQIEFITIAWVVMLGAFVVVGGLMVVSFATAVAVATFRDWWRYRG